jgi:hypothetical protein
VFGAGRCPSPVHPIPDLPPQKRYHEPFMTATRRRGWLYLTRRHSHWPFGYSVLGPCTAPRSTRYVHLLFWLCSHSAAPRCNLQDLLARKRRGGDWMAMKCSPQRTFYLHEEMEGEIACLHRNYSKFHPEDTRTCIVQFARSLNKALAGSGYGRYMVEKVKSTAIPSITPHIRCTEYMRLVAFLLRNLFTNGTGYL